MGHKAQSGRENRLWASDAGLIHTHKEPDRATPGAARAHTGHGGKRPPCLGHWHPGQRVDFYHGGGCAGQSAGHHLSVQEPQAEECG